MKHTTRWAAALCSVMIAVAPAVAGPPRSLRMRPRALAPTPWSPHYWARRVAQAAASDPATPDPATPDPAAPAPDPTTPAPAAELDEAELAKLAEQAARSEVITVTGSTIERKTLTTTAPMTILRRADLEASGRATLGDILQQLPAQANAINAQVNSGGDGSTRIDLRSLGVGRTLTLINGRRMVPGGTGADNSVDLNTVPLAAVDRVEILKGAAAAVYGSEAIGGVVNIITRNDFNGATAQLYTAGTPHGDGFSYDASWVAGHTSQDHKGRIAISFGAQRQYAVFAGDRAFARADVDFDYATRQPFVVDSLASNGGRIDALAIDRDRDGVGDGIPLCGAGERYCTRDGDGAYRPFLASDHYNEQALSYLYTPSERYNFFAAANYKLLPTVSVILEALYLRRTSDQELPPVGFSAGDTGIAVSKDNVFNQLGADVTDYSRRLDEFGPRHAHQEITTFRIVAGLEGAIADDAPVFRNWRWELSFNLGRTENVSTRLGELRLTRLAQAVGPSFQKEDGSMACGQPPNGVELCTPIDLLGPAGSIAPASRGFLTYNGTSGGHNQQKIFLGDAHGRIATLPNHGDLSLAVGANVRTDDGVAYPDPLTLTGESTGQVPETTEGNVRAVEGYGELSLVPISGHPLAQWVELDLAARSYHYNSFGSGVTWKLGGLVRTVGGLAARGTYSTAFRAPSLTDLFQASGIEVLALEDPCDTRPASAGGTPIQLGPVAVARCSEQQVATDAAFGASQLRSLIGGNTKLDAETAKVLTAGLVLEPPQVKGLSFTVDYWHVDVAHAIQRIATATVLASCYTRDQPEACARIHRDPEHDFRIDFVDTSLQNVGGTTTSGLDLAALFDHAIAGVGRFREQLEAQYLFKYNLDDGTRVLHGRGAYDLGVLPTFKANLGLAWDHPIGIGAGLNLRYVGGFDECRDNDCTAGEPAHAVDAWYKVDVIGSYTLRTAAGKTTLAVGVNNVFDRDPPLIYVGPQGNSDGRTYDLLGRMVYARMTHLF